jgi:hypothetical protein
MNDSGQVEQLRAYDQPVTFGCTDVYFKGHLALHQFQLDDAPLPGEAIRVAYREYRPVRELGEYRGGLRLFCLGDECQMA